MSNEVIKPNQTGLGALGALKAIRTGLANVKAAMPQVGGKPILRMLQEKDGWVFGQEDNALPLGTEVVFNTLTIQHGYVIWTDRKGEKNELLDEKMYPITQAAPSIYELPVINDPKTGKTCEWKQAFNADAKVVTGKFKGTEIVYKPSSMGGAQAMGELMGAILDKFATYADDYKGPMYILPVVELQQNPPYLNKSGGKTYPPHFEIVGWMDLEGNEEDGDEEDGAPEPVTAKLAPPPEPEPVAEEPARRRRRA